MVQRGQQPARVVRRPGARRNNAPIRRRKPAPILPDVLFAMGAMAWAMALIFAFASFLSDNVTAGDAGRMLARVFAAALFVSGLFVILLGVALLRDDRANIEHYVVPMSIGTAAGALEAYLFLLPAGEWLWAPPILLVLALRPVRSGFGRIVHPAHGAAR